MDLIHCYRILGISVGASAADVKSAYRRLAREYHPDVNPENIEWANQRFIEVTEAYQTLSNVGHAALANAIRRARQQSSPQPSRSSQPSHAKPRVTVRKSSKKPPTVKPSPHLSDIDNRLKRQSYQQLQDLLKHQRFPRAIALVEGLAQRIQNDPEVQQWQAITYQQWARALADQRDFRKARIYLKKALKVDPQNRRLWTEIKQEYQRIERAMVNQR